MLVWVKATYKNLVASVHEIVLSIHAVCLLKVLLVWGDFFLSFQCLASVGNDGTLPMAVFFLSSLGWVFFNIVVFISLGLSLMHICVQVNVNNLFCRLRKMFECI